MEWTRPVAIPILLATALLNAAPASAVCVTGIPLCESFWSYEAVFEGTVTSIEQKTASDPASPFQSLPERFRPPFRIVTFEIQRSWRGPGGPRISLLVQGGPGPGTPVAEAVVNYSQGERYLVFAGRMAEGDFLTTSACDVPNRLSGTDPRAAMAFLESISRPSSGGRVFGRIYDEGSFVPGQPRKPSVETRVTLASDGITRALTSSGGVFSFADLQPGTYKLTVDVPDRFTGPDTAEFTIPDTHACIDRSFVFKRRVGIELSTR